MTGRKFTKETKVPGDQSGQPLESSTRRQMEASFKSDFSAVHVHIEAPAALRASSLGARAFTMGEDITFGSDRYQPHTTEGRGLIAHELTHVIQQRHAKPSSAPSPSMGVAAEEEAEQASIAAASGRTVAPIVSKAATVQRSPADAVAFSAPTWPDLPSYAQSDLVRAGISEAKFSRYSDELRQTVLNLYVKMSGVKPVDLWNWIETADTDGPGRVKFKAKDGLKKLLDTLDDFTWVQSGDVWDSREKQALGSLHFKHFKDDPWVQAHIDLIGPVIPYKWWILTPTDEIAQLIAHGATYEAYEDVSLIRNQLLSQGWDPSPLQGVSSGQVQRQDETPALEATQKRDHAHAAVQLFRTSAGGSAWASLNRWEISDSLDSRIDNPDLIRQSVLNACGPAVILHMLAEDDPTRFVTIADRLFETGRADLGGEMLEAGTDLRGNSPPAGMDPLDWMFLSAIRDSENVIFDYEGTPSEDFSAISTPGDLVHWMRSILKCSTVDWDSAYLMGEMSVIENAGRAVAAGKRVALLISAEMLSSSPTLHIYTYPDHWVILKSGVKIGPRVEFDVWTWGLTTLTHIDLDRSTFRATFFGAATCGR